MQLIKIESEQITLPFEVFNELRGKQVRFVRYQDGFVMKPASESFRKGKLAKLSKLKPRQLVNDNPDDLVDIKVWNEPENLRFKPSMKGGNSCWQMSNERCLRQTNTTAWQKPVF